MVCHPSFIFNMSFILHLIFCYLDFFHISSFIVCHSYFLFYISSLIFYISSVIFHYLSFMFQLLLCVPFIFFIFNLFSSIIYWLSFLYFLFFILCYLSYIFFHSYSIFYLQSSKIFHSSFINQHPSFIIYHLTLAFIFYHSRFMILLSCIVHFLLFIIPQLTFITYLSSFFGVSSFILLWYFIFCISLFIFHLWSSIFHHVCFIIYFRNLSFICLLSFVL